MNAVMEQTLSELEKTQHEFWNVARETGNFLNMLVKISGCKNGLEIGTSNGYSGLWLGEAFKKNQGKLSTVEYWEKRQSIAIENFEKCGVSDVIESILGAGIDVLKEWKEPLDFVFLDANKAQYIEFFELIDKYLVKGGIITADNITSHPDKVKPFVDAIKADERYQTEILPLPAGLLVAYKIK